MTISDLIDYLSQFDDKDIEVFLTEDQAAEALSDEEYPEYITLDHVLGRDAS